MATTLRPIPCVITGKHARNKRVILQNFILKFEIGSEFSSNQAAVAANLTSANGARSLLSQRDDVIPIGKGMWRKIK